MTVNTQTLTPERIKQQAKILRRTLAGFGTELSHAQALETLSQINGHRDWNTFKALMDRLAKTPPKAAKMTPGDRVAGTYLGHPITGTLVGMDLYGSKGLRRVSVQLDTPVDVVTFDSFSSLRHRVSGVINAEGQTTETTSDGTPHLSLRAA